MPYTEKQLISALRKIEKNWPGGYTLFSWSGSLHLLQDELIPEGEKQYINGHTGYAGSYHDASVATFPGIPNDGGDPD